MCGSSRRWGRRPCAARYLYNPRHRGTRPLTPNRAGVRRLGGDTDTIETVRALRREEHPEPPASVGTAAIRAVMRDAHGGNLTDRRRPPDDELVVRVTGGAVRGVRERGLIAWRGIPYPAPPVGELRFAAPDE